MEISENLSSPMSAVVDSDLFPSGSSGDGTLGKMQALEWSSA